MIKKRRENVEMKFKFGTIKNIKIDPYKILIHPMEKTDIYKYRNPFDMVFLFL